MIAISQQTPILCKVQFLFPCTILSSEVLNLTWQIVDKTIIYADKDGDGRVSFEEFAAVGLLLRVGWRWWRGGKGFATLTLLNTNIGVMIQRLWVNQMYAWNSHPFDAIHLVNIISVQYPILTWHLSGCLLFFGLIIFYSNLLAFFRFFLSHFGYWRLVDDPCFYVQSFILNYLSGLEMVVVSQKKST